MKVAPLSTLHCTARKHGMTVPPARVAAACAFTVLALLALPAAARAAGQTGDGQTNPAQTTSPQSSTSASPGTSANPQALPATVAPAFRDAASGVEVYTQLDAAMFPPTWREPAIGAAARPLSPSERARAVRLSEVALSKYPSQLLKLNLERIYVVGALQFQGISASGTNSADRLYIVIDANDPLYTDTFVEESFHHEFAHMLRRNYPDFLSDAEWIRNNPPDFHYGAPSGVEAVKTGHSSLLPSDDWNRLGFMSEYGAEDPAEDFATIAGSLFTGDAAFWQRTDRFIALGNKIKTAIGFFTRLAPSFTEPYFRGLHPGLAYVPRTSAPPTLAPPTVTASAAAPASGQASPPAGSPAAKP